MNYYELLEIRENASPEVVEMAYKALVRKYHPDVYRGDSEVAHDITQKINEAHGALADPETRARYDASLNAEDSGPAKSDKDKMRKGQWWISLPRCFTAGALVLFLLCLVLAVVSGMLGLRLSTLQDENQRLNSSLASVKSTLSTMETNNANLQKTIKTYSSDLKFYYDRACVIADYSKRYHHLGCLYLNPNHAYILDVENADRLGYTPCPQCWDRDFDQFYETRGAK